MAAFSPLLRQRAVPFAAAALGAGFAVVPLRKVHAESPDDRLSRKPIYDDTPLIPALPPTDANTADPSPSSPTSSFTASMTERLAKQIGYGRVFLHSRAVTLEDRVNDALDRTLALEQSFTTTIASLAPPKESNEKLVPGLLYVLVSSMAGSILTRNRNILLRASVPAAVGLGMAWAVIPTTMTNVSDLVWSYEKRFPVIADNHERAATQIRYILETGKAHTGMSMGMLQDKMTDAREAVEGWIKKGK